MLIKTEYVADVNERTKKEIYHECYINSDMICGIDCDAHEVHFAAPDGWGMSSYGLHWKIRSSCWSSFIRDCFAAEAK